MSEIRQRKLKDDIAPTSSNVRTRPLKQPRRLRRVFIFLIVLALCGTYFLGIFAGQTPWFDGLAKSLGYESVYHYAVIIDAGSSGSRVLAYKFRVPFTVFGQANLDLEEEYFEESKPGLSSYVDDPEKGADTIVQLIKKAEFLIPREKRRATPLVVRATAGLRLLPPAKAQELIDQVSLAISKLGYDVGTNGVEIMEGSDEGIFIWYTVNLLHNLLAGETMAALDLGGGSTQITYRVPDDDDSYPPADRFVVPAGNNITLYTHSYLRLGLLAARHGVLKLEAGGGDGTTLRSVCVDPIVKDEKWTYANTVYSISGAERAAGAKREAVYSRCAALVKRYVLATLDWEPQQPPRGAVAAMSYFYDVAADAGIIDVMRGGSATPGQFRAAALRACSAANVEQPWACLDLTYITALLVDAYKLRERDNISLFKKVNGHEVSWALGLAYTTIMNKVAAAAAAA
ncbi:ectonucleoside triphosphate diphosphohydrolase 5 isoform X2 [Aricia agestis]|uniref:ectonucleoside triphosphate diphosphohydrolase 5 isoform X2 n=1 Tax=Aricia agestis TaxID=91739 RepID=UPI001C20572D|nr:ectonucleoside triphosphate diphosphohydrolase 5 isoform X2 [Aricia agestis]